MGQKADKSDESIGKRERRERFLIEWPRHGFKVAAAGRAVGYSTSYANTKLAIVLRQDVEFTRRMDATRAENLGLADDKVVALDVRLDNLIDSGKLTPALMLKALELRYRRLGALQDKTIIESAERERELSASARAEARKLAVHLMSKGTPKAG